MKKYLEMWKGWSLADRVIYSFSGFCILWIAYVILSLVFFGNSEPHTPHASGKPEVISQPSKPFVPHEINHLTTGFTVEELFNLEMPAGFVSTANLDLLVNHLSAYIQQCGTFIDNCKPDVLKVYTKVAMLLAVEEVKSTNTRLLSTDKTVSLINKLLSSGFYKTWGNRWRQSGEGILWQRDLLESMLVKQ